MEVDPVPRYEGSVLFRSTLEADWAATLTSLLIHWEYEPEGIQLPNGEGYVPDFRLPKIGAWLEVKGDGVPREEKARQLAEMRVCHCEGECNCDWPGGEIVLIGRPAIRSNIEKRMRFGAMHWHDALGGNALLVRCGHCGEHSWCRPRHSLLCRVCRHKHTTHLHNSGEIEFHHASRKPWAVA